MSISNEVALAGGTPRSVEVTADVTIGPDDKNGGFALPIRLEAVVEADGLDNEAFATAAKAAETGCLVSKALAAIDVQTEVVRP